MATYSDEQPVIRIFKNYYSTLPENPLTSVLKLNEWYLDFYYQFGAKSGSHNGLFYTARYSPIYSKKRLDKSILKCYVISKSYGETNGQVGFNFFIKNNFIMDHNNPGSSTRPFNYGDKHLKDISVNSYNTIECRSTYVLSSEIIEKNKKDGIVIFDFSANMGTTFSEFYPTHQYGNAYASITLEEESGPHRASCTNIYTDVTPYASNLIPNNNMFIATNIDNIFKWEFTYNVRNVFDKLKQKSAKLRYRLVGSTEYTEIFIDSDANNYTLPANTFELGLYEWQVILTSDDDIEGYTIQWNKFSTVDVIPTAEIISPNNILLDGMKDNIFSWNHIISTNSKQSKYDIQCSDDNGTSWVDLKSEITNNNFATISSDLLPQGQIMWRVRTYNSYSQSSNWSNPASIIVKSAPQQAEITSISNKSRPFISWKSTSQQAFQVLISKNDNIIIDTGTIAKFDKFYQIQEYLENGAYTVQIIITNIYGLSSVSNLTSFIVQTAKPVIPTISSEIQDGAVKINISNSTSGKYYIIRNNILINKLVNKNYFIDYSAVGINQYVVRIIDDNDNFIDSNIISVETKLKSSVLSIANNSSKSLILKYRRGSKVTKNYDVNLSTTKHFLAGREYAISEFSEFKTATQTFQYFLFNDIELSTFKSIVDTRNTVILRDVYCETFYGIISSYNYIRNNKGIDLQFKMEMVDYVEKIQYDKVVNYDNS